MRINQFLAKSNLGSRRHVEELILQGKITVNGKVCKELATVIAPEKDVVQFNGKTVEISQELIYIMLNKPFDYVVTKSDEFGRKTVYALLPDFARNLNPVGRLDMDSEGLLILTNDGFMANQMMHPKFKLEKTYKVEVQGIVNRESLERLRSGVEIEGTKTQSARVFVKSRSGDKSVLRITIREGKKRQIRRMIETIGCKVLALKRLQIGDITLEKLPVGMWRYLTTYEILSLKRSLSSKSIENKKNNKLDHSGKI
ncbi:MAG TPA: pseudouridine synthase [Candidatus Cloacimonadota bacterium]|nr:pseudouridine synthase [Candidatus Cloacimonadota bacterium]